jgi:hypothetical protein
MQQLFAGKSLADGGEVLVALDLLPLRIDIEAFRRTLGYEHSGIFTLAYLGRLDMLPNVDHQDQVSRWALVERVSAGSWLTSLIGSYELRFFYDAESHMLPSHNPATAVRNALSLGRSAGRILAAAAAAGTLLPYVRPEYMWARDADGALEVTGLSARGHAFFAKTTIDAVSLPLFDRYYYAPEADEDPDDRALVFALAIMIAEWATGRFPFKYKFHGQGPLEGKHLKLKLPAPLASLLSRGMRVDRAERPDLAQFLDELGRC